MYKQNLYEIIKPIKLNTIKGLIKERLGNMAITKNMTL
jgi:hypothetical protein